MPTPSILIVPRRVNNSWTVGLTKAEVSPSVFTPLSPSIFPPHQILYSPSLSLEKCGWMMNNDLNLLDLLRKKGVLIGNFNFWKILFSGIKNSTYRWLLFDYNNIPILKFKLFFIWVKVHTTWAEVTKYSQLTRDIQQNWEFKINVYYIVDQIGHGVNPTTWSLHKTRLNYKYTSYTDIGILWVWSC